MFWKKKSKSKQKKETTETKPNQSFTIRYPLPEFYHEYAIYSFISYYPYDLLKAFYEQIDISSIYEQKFIDAIKQRIENIEFENPIDFKSEFKNNFDFISIDFETANNKRISACAIGFCLFKNNKIISESNLNIKPPENEPFLASHVSIHGINYEDVEYSLNFKDLWSGEISNMFNNNLICLHNSSMDASILKQLFEHYKILNYSINYIDTMQVAKDIGLPGKLTELCNHFDIDFDNIHDPEEDSKVCGFVYLKLKELVPDISKYIKTISPEKENKKAFFNQFNETAIPLDEYRVKEDDLSNFELTNKNVVVTGDFDFGRKEIEQFIKEKGATLKPGISGVVNYVIIGDNYGPSKAKKIKDFNDNKGKNIQILKESDFMKILEN